MWLHPLCCLTMEGPAIGDPSPEPAALLRTGSAIDLSAVPRSEINSVAGILYKWTNFGKGWRSRWFTLRSNGVLSYSKTSDVESQPGGDLVLIGSGCGGDRRGGSKRGKSSRIVHLKICSFRESKSDDRKFYIFTASKALHLRTKTVKERVAWTQALISLRSLFSLRQQSVNASFLTRELSVSTERLKQRLLKDGVGDGLVKECEQIMLSEFSGIQGQFRTLCEERSGLLDTVRKLEAANISAETPGISDGEYQLIKNMYIDTPSRKYIEWSTTESLDDVEKQELEETSDDDIKFFDAEEELCPEVMVERETVKVLDNPNAGRKTLAPRRNKLPDPVEKEKAISLWSVIKDNIGKDLTRVCLPVYFNEPISSLQKCFEDMEYSHLLDQAHEHGKAGNSLMRILTVAAFAVSGYASSEGRHRKPFNPLLGETYEADYPEKGLRFFSEKVSHHPTVIACHCEGKGWKFWCDTNLKSKFWGRSIQLDPVGTLNLEFDDGEIFRWSKVTTSIYNLIIGNISCDHHGTMHIQGSGQYSCRLKFKERSIIERSTHQVHGVVEDVSGKKVARVFGKWDESMHCAFEEETCNGEQFLLWKREKPPENLTQYNLTSFAVTLNELTPGLKEMLPPTDSRLRPDQRYLENGEFEKANAEKLRLETRQRMSTKLQENGWRPKWFLRDRDGQFRYTGEYWEARERGDWGECSDIFGEINPEE